MTPTRTPKSRCYSCVFFEHRDHSGQDICYRSYPADSDFVDNCKIRMPGKHGKWVSAFKERASYRIDFDELFGKEIKPMSDLTLEEKKQLAKSYINKYSKSVEKTKGSQIIAAFGDDLPEQYKKFKRLPLGIPSLDKFFGGGLPMGGMITMGGAESSGKTSIALRIIAAVQRAGGLAGFADAEGTLDLDWATVQGVNTSDLLVMASGIPKEQDFTPTTLEDYLNGVTELINLGYMDLVVLDSLDAMMARGRLKAKAGKKRDLDNADIALKARVLSDFYPRILGACRANGTTLLQIGQLRATGIGSAFVSNTVSGGNARKFYDLLTLMLRRGEKKNWPKGDSETDLLGYSLVMKATKVKVSGLRENDQMETAFFYGTGFDRDYEVVAQALEEGIIRKKKGASQAFFTTQDGEELKIPVGKTHKITQWVKEHELYHEIWQQLTGEIIPDGCSYADFKARETTEVVKGAA